MKIPRDLAERQMLYAQVADTCLRSRDDRVTDYVRRECYYLNGADAGQPPAVENKIFSSIQMLTSFMFSADTTSYTVDLDAEVEPKYLDMVPPVAKVINKTWWSSDADAVADQCTEWSAVYNTMLMKVLWVNGAFRGYAVRPHEFGVYQEDVMSVDDQEAMVHCYTITRPALERMLDGHPKKAKIMEEVQNKPTQMEQPSDGLNRLILTASAPITPANPNMVGALASNALRAAPNYDAVLPEDLVEMRELWIWNDDEHDYQVVTMAGNVTVFDRQAGEENAQGKRLFLKGENPFVKFCPCPKYNYFFGTSDAERVAMLQDALNARNDDFENLLQKQVRPPVEGIGFLDEQLAALMTVGGIANSSEPFAAAKLHVPEIPEALFKAFEKIDEGFADALALHNIMQGKGEPGVRGRGHAQELARISSARIKRKALKIEDALEKVGALMLKLMAANDDTVLHVGGIKFNLAQFPEECSVKVDAHSNSPIFAEDNRALADHMLEAEVIDGESYIELTKPPQTDLLKERYKVLQKRREEAKMMEMQSKQSGGQ